MINSLGYIVITPRVSEVGKIQLKIVFWSTIEAPSKKTVYLQELVTVFKDVVNNIVEKTLYGVNGNNCIRFKNSSNL